MTLLRQFVSSACKGLRGPVAGGVLLAGLAACGGGDTVSDFQPDRILVFGDESSLLTEDGKNYSINGLETPAPDEGASAPDSGASEPQIDCRGRRIWVQVLADSYGFRFAECNESEGTPRGRMLAEVEAQVQRVAEQIDAFVAVDSFSPKDLVTVLVGQHDIRQIHNDLGKPAQCSAAAGEGGPARAKGAALAAQINRIADNGRGGRVLFVTVVRQGDTPTGRAEGRQCLNDLTDAFNAGLRRAVVNDGRQIALVAISEQAEVIVDDPDRFRDFDNVSEGQCTVPLPDCTTATLKEPGSDYLWADGLHFGPEFHDLLGDLAVDRVRNDVPF